MLADAQINAQAGSLGSDVHLPATSLQEILDFIGSELPHWRDRPDRKAADTETVLSSQLCAHLNSKSRHSSWDFLQFRTEEPDETNQGRKIDIVPAPSGVAVWVEGRKYSDFDPLLPIECKRLPTPKDASRDEREYVYSSKSTTGGIQRFKAGHHGATHTLGAMIGYVQEGNIATWNSAIKSWIDGLVSGSQSGWAFDDHLELVSEDISSRTAHLKSKHARDKGLTEIAIRHLWVTMN